MNEAPVPATELPRLFRYVPAGALPGDDLVVVYDPTQNLLVINKDAYERLCESDRKVVQRTHRTLTTKDFH